MQKVVTGIRARETLPCDRIKGERRIWERI
jgi:hypothetical protein